MRAIIAVLIVAVVVLLIWVVKLTVMQPSEEEGTPTTGRTVTPIAAATTRTEATPTSRPLSSILPSPLPASVVVSGNFEEPSAGNKYITKSEGDVIDGWRVEGTVEVTGTYWQAAKGLQSVDLHGYKPGAIYRDFGTVPGRSYEVCFAVSGNPTGGETKKILEVSWNGTLVAYLVIDTAFRSPSQMGWQYQRYRIIAGGTDARVKFQGVAGGSHWGPVIDDIRIGAGDVGCKGNVQNIALPTPTPIPTATSTATATPTAVQTPTGTPTATTTPALGEATPTPFPTLTPVPTKIAVRDPVEIVVGELFPASRKPPFLAGQGTVLAVVQFVSRGRADVQLQAVVDAPSGLVVEVQGVDTSGRFELKAGETVYLNFVLGIPSSVKAGTYGPIEMEVRSSVLQEAKHIVLVEEIEVLPALELVEEEHFECDSSQVGEECRIIRAVIENHSGAPRIGCWEGKIPEGLEAFWRYAEEDTERRPLCSVPVGPEEEVAIDVFLVPTRGPLEFSVPELTFREA